MGRDAFLARLPAQFRSDFEPWSGEWLMELGVHREVALIDAVAAMIAQADVQRRRKPEAEASAPLPFSPNELYAQLKARVSDKVALYPVEHRLFGFLGGKLKAIVGLEAADAERVVSWIEAGGLANWTTQPTFAHIVQNIGKFVAYARTWDQRGRQQIRRGQLNVGMPVSDATEESLGEDFR